MTPILYAGMENDEQRRNLDQIVGFRISLIETSHSSLVRAFDFLFTPIFSVFPL
jgi:hypothetical protein